jgi:hypothetical protein
MAKKKHRSKAPLVPLPPGARPEQGYESYNPMLEEDVRTGRRFGIGLGGSLLVNFLMFTGAAAIATQLTPEIIQQPIPPAQFTLVEPVKMEPTPPPQSTPPPPEKVQVAQVEPQRIIETPPPVHEHHEEPTPPPVKELPRETPPPVSTPPPPQEKPRPVETPPPAATPPPVQSTPPPQAKQAPVQLAEAKPETVDKTAVTMETQHAATSAAATSAAAEKVRDVAHASSEALQSHLEAGSASEVSAPTMSRVTGPVGATTLHAAAMSNKPLTALNEAASSGMQGAAGPSAPTAAGAAAGAGPALNARAVAATGASSNMVAQISPNTGSAGAASVIASQRTQTITGPMAMVGPHLARSKQLTALGAVSEDANNFTVQQGGVVTAGQVVGTQGSTSAKVGRIASGENVIEAQFTGANNGIESPVAGGRAIGGPVIASGPSGLAGPHVSSRVAALGGSTGQMGAAGLVNSALPGGGGVRGAGNGGAGGAAGVRGGGFGNGGSGSDLGIASSGGTAVASNAYGRPADGVAGNGSSFGMKGPHSGSLSTTGVGGLAGESGNAAGDVDGKEGGGGLAGRSTGTRNGGVGGGGPSGGSLGTKDGGAAATIASTTATRKMTDTPESKTPSRFEGEGEAGITHNATVIRRVEPIIPEDLKSEQFAASVVAKFTVHINGSCDVELIERSGNSQIDTIVSNALRQWRWKPAVEGGSPVESTLTQEVDISIK